MPNRIKGNKSDPIITTIEQKTADELLDHNSRDG